MEELLSFIDGFKKEITLVYGKAGRCLVNGNSDYLALDRRLARSKPFKEAFGSGATVRGFAIFAYSLAEFNLPYTLDKAYQASFA